MCVEADAHPPIEPKGTAHTRRLQLTADDGNIFDAFEATTDDEPTRTAVVVLPDVRGLFQFYEELAECLAEAGHDAIAIDYFGRTAGTGPRDDDFDFMSHVAQTTSEGINADIAAAVAHLRERSPEVSIFTVGFCFGGTCSWAATTHDHGLAGAVGFYGKPDIDRPTGDGPFLDRASLVAAPILALMGGDDPSIPPATVDALQQALDGTDVPTEVVTYEGAPHSFFDRHQSDHASASADAWRRILAFVDAHAR